MMKTEIADTVIGYHYSNPQAYKSMQDGTNYRKVGLIPIKRFIRLDYGFGLPDEAHDGVVEGLLEPEPKSWTENPEFPYLWRSLIHDICKESEIMLLSFELKQEDKAYIVERAHIDRELYREAKNQGRSTSELMKKAFKQYWESRIPVFEYDGSYSIPQLSIWSKIEFNRLKVEWVKPTNQVWQRVLDNNW
ncbi:MAG: hypothetical protein Q8R37_00870 [Nanoarchaeota archaeon]|nr:hypothetical protein [Nanoarchaeota archaeon]